MTRPLSPVWIPEGAPCVFPDPHRFNAQGLIAGGADLAPERLLAAYRSGIFPWYDEPPILWWSPDPRAIITPKSLHVSRSLRRRMRQNVFYVTTNQDPEQVLDACADRDGGTWLSAEMKSAYLRLFDLGHLVTYEVWDRHAPSGGRTAHLVGGLYGVLVDGVFAAESKFHRKTDASKVALVCAVLQLFDRGVELFDVQFSTDHLRSLGVHEISRFDYLRALRRLGDTRVRLDGSSTDLLPEILGLLGTHTTPPP